MMNDVSSAYVAELPTPVSVKSATRIKSNTTNNNSAEYLRVNAGVTYIGSNAKARRELGYEPRDLKEGLTQTLQHEMQLLGKNKL